MRLVDFCNNTTGVRGKQATEVQYPMATLCSTGRRPFSSHSSLIGDNYPSPWPSCSTRVALCSRWLSPATSPQPRHTDCRSPSARSVRGQFPLATYSVPRVTSYITSAIVCCFLPVELFWLRHDCILIRLDLIGLLRIHQTRCSSDWFCVTSAINFWPDDGQWLLWRGVWMLYLYIFFKSFVMSTNRSSMGSDVIYIPRIV